MTRQPMTIDLCRLPEIGRKGMKNVRRASSEEESEK